MPTRKKTMRVAMPAWEIGRAGTGLGVKVGGLGVIVEELPAELVAAAERQQIRLEIEILTPCFAHYDREKLTDTGLRIPVTLDGNTFDFQVYKHTFIDGQTVVYFWDEWQLNWTSGTAIYPSDPVFAFRTFATVSQAMAGYIKQKKFHTVHSHDYHVGLVPFYLGDTYLQDVPYHFTIHNATYQGRFPVNGNGYDLLNQVNLSGEQLFHKYFDHFDHVNLMKATMLKAHESGGKITTVSGDLQGTWGYAAELKESADTILGKAIIQKGGDVGEVFVPNQYLDLFEKLPITGITNGLAAKNKAEYLVELNANHLKSVQARRGTGAPIFQHPDVQTAMLETDHNFDKDRLHIKAELKSLLHREAFGTELGDNPILITAVGRLVAQKNFGIIVDVVERTLVYDERTKFIILASAPDGDGEGKATEQAFFNLASLYPERVFFDNGFNLPFSKLIFAGGDFSLIPSRFEPCGLVDYEASLLGNIVIGRLTGGLAKVRDCAYLYEWLDISDRVGEANVFFDQIKNAIDTYRHNPAHHWQLIQKAMTLDATWDRSAGQYVELYRYGLLMKKWHHRRQKLMNDYLKALGDDQTLFQAFFLPAQGDYGDALDWALYDALSDP
ncbi:MAG: glycogen/starch synthase [Chloroflexota bacterium]